MQYDPRQPYPGQPPQAPPYQASSPQAQSYLIQPSYVPQAYPVQPYVQPQYAQPQMTPEEYRQNNYRRLLRRTVNSLGGLLLFFLGLEFTLSIILMLIVPELSNISESNPLFLLENGLISVLIFFVCGLIYCLIRRVRFADIFPFQKIGASYCAKLCVIGLTFSLMSNYVVDMLNKTFGLFGIENTGGNIDTGSEPNVLLYFLTVAILPALVEEFAFRGVVMGVLRPYSEGLAILISSAAFALMHGNFVQLPFTFCCGLVFAYIDIKTNSLLPSIIIHFFNNGLSVLFDVLTTYGIISDMIANLCYGVIFIVLAVLSFVFLKRMASADNGSLFTLQNGDSGILFKNKVKTAVTSPTMIIFAVLMLLYCVLVLFLS